MAVNIFVDVDGVLLDWDKGFETYKKNNSIDQSVQDWETIKKYHLSDVYADLDLIEGATKGLANLAVNLPKVNIRVMTNSNDNPIQLYNRQNNLKKYFGSEYVRSGIFLPAGTDKASIAKKQYPNDRNLLIDDHFTKAKGFVEAGFQSVWFASGYRTEEVPIGFTQAESWDNVLDVIVNGPWKGLEELGYR